MYLALSFLSYNNLFVCANHLRYGNESGVAKLIVGNKSDLAGKRAVDYSTAKVFICVFNFSATIEHRLGICRFDRRPLSRDLRQECRQRRAGLFDDGEADKGQGTPIECVWHAYTILLFAYN